MQEGRGQAAVVVRLEDVSVSVAVGGDVEGVREGGAADAETAGHEAGEAGVGEELALAVVEKGTKLGEEDGQLADLFGFVEDVLGEDGVVAGLPGIPQLKEQSDRRPTLDVFECLVEVVEFGVDGLGALLDQGQVAAGQTQLGVAQQQTVWVDFGEEIDVEGGQHDGRFFGLDPQFPEQFGQDEGGTPRETVQTPHEDQGVARCGVGLGGAGRDAGQLEVAQVLVQQTGPVLEGLDATG